MMIDSIRFRTAPKKLSRFHGTLVLLICLFLTDGAAGSPASHLPSNSEGDYLYRITLVQAAPGHFRDFMDLMTREFDLISEQGDERPYWMRHSQGDIWDFFIIYPMVDYDVYYGQDRLHRIAAYAQDWAAFEEEEDRLVARREDLYVRGTAWEDLVPVLERSGYFHIEMFVALPGKRAELLAQRRMENEYLAAIGRPVNFIFRREAGAAIDSFTLGCYRDLKHFAESADIPIELEDSAARAAGFNGVADISPYLRSLIARHHDTLAVAIN